MYSAPRAALAPWLAWAHHARSSRLTRVCQSAASSRQRTRNEGVDVDLTWRR